MPEELLPRDAQGRALPHDHPGIDGNCRLIRRISAEWIVLDRSTGRQRLSSACLSPSTPSADIYCGLSVDIEAFILAAGIEPAAHVTTPKHMASIAIKAHAFRSRGFLAGHDPSPGNPFHGCVWQVEGRSKLTAGIQKQLLREAEWLVEAGGASII